MLSSQGERTLTRTLPNLFKSGIVSAFQSEFGIYPGGTEMGIDVRDARRKIKGSDTMHKASNIYKDAFGVELVKEDEKNKKIKLTPDDRKKALKSLAWY